jgi:molybdate transport system substrate-binding protein
MSSVAVSNAAELVVLTSQGAIPGVRELGAAFARATGHKVTALEETGSALEQRLANGPADLITVNPETMDDLIKKGRIVAGTVAPYMVAGLGISVRAGAPKPDVSTVDAYKATLLAAKSIGYSTGPSGVYVITMFQKMGIADEIKSKLKQTPTGVFVGSIIASGEAEIGFQQVSELSFFPGIDYVGPIPAEVQLITVFSAGIPAGTKQADAAKALVSFITAPAAAAIFKKHALDPG